VAAHGDDRGRVLLAGRLLTAAGLERLLAPRSIALLGASADPRKFGGRPLAALRRHGFDGDLWVVNPRHREIGGVPCVPSVEDLPEGLDLVVCLLPAQAALPALEACAARGAGAALVMSGGFREAGEEGAARQEALARMARERGLRVLGPNCPGYVNGGARVACSASAYATRETMPTGPLAFVLQSGAVAGILCDRAFDRGLGVRYAVCTGNEADVTAAEVLAHVAGDSEVRAVGLFLEGAADGAALADAIRAARAAGVGVAALKVGRSAEARAVVASHTAALVGSDEAFDALCASLGVVRAGDYDELLEATALLAAPAHPGRRLAVVGASGGMNTLLADVLADRGLALPPLAPETVARMRGVVPEFGSALNPADISSVLLTEPGRLGDALLALAEDPGVDGLVVVIGDHPPRLAAMLADAVVDAAERGARPVVAQWSAGSLSAGGIAALGRAGVPVVESPSRAAALIAAALRAEGRPAAPAIVGREVPARAAWSESEAKALLAEHGIPVPGPPAGGRAVVKADCVGTVHKTELGAVRVGVPPEGVEAAAAEVVAAARAAVGPDRVRGALVEALVPPGVELLVAVRREPGLGAVVTVAAGGELVEVLADSASRLAPVDDDEAGAMIGELRVARLLDGHRGRPVLDRAAAARALAAVSRLGAAWGERLGTVEVNPLRVLPEGAVALDALVEVAP
jgi:acetate---CoA ligase (ADP-forming)